MLEPGQSLATSLELLTLFILSFLSFAFVVAWVLLLLLLSRFLLLRFCFVLWCQRLNPDFMQSHLSSVPQPVLYLLS